MPNLYLSQFQVGGSVYNLKDGKAREALWKLIGTGDYSDAAFESAITTIAALGTAASMAYTAASLTDAGMALPTEGAVKAYVDAQVGSINKFDIVIDSAGTEAGPSVTASADTMYKIYLVPAGAQAGTYVEWITIRSGEEGSYTYAWEKIGTTEADLTNYVKKTTTIAGADLQSNITSATLSTNLGLSALAFKDSAAVTGEAAITFESADAVVTQGAVTASGTISVTLSDVPSQQAVITAGTSSFTPAGTVAITGSVVTNAALVSATAADIDTGAVQVAGTVAAPTVYVDLANDNSTTFVTGSALKTATWTGSDYTAPTATLASLTYEAAGTGSFATEGVTTEVSGEMLIFGTANRAAANTDGTKVTGWNAGAFNAGSLTFGTFTTTAADTADKTYVTGLTSASATAPTFTGSYLKVNTTSGDNQLTAAFTGAASDYTIVSKVEYTKQAIETATFTGIAASTVGVAVAYSKAESTASVTGTAQ